MCMRNSLRAGGIPMLALLLLAGCTGAEDAATADGGGEAARPAEGVYEISAMGITITRDSPPEEVAGLLIRALDYQEDDEVAQAEGDANADADEQANGQGQADADASEKFDAPTFGLLLSLVAVDHAVDDLQRIGRGRLKVTPDSAAKMAATGWAATYMFHEKGTSELEEDSTRITGDEAFVYFRCRNKAGDDVRLEVHLVREDGWWKVMPGIKTVP